MNKLFTTTVLSAGVLMSPAYAEESIKIGLLATLEGPFTILGQDAQRGAELAVRQFNGVIDGHPIEWVIGSTDASPDSALQAVRKLVEQSGVSIVVGPLSGDEGMAVKDYARSHPEVTFVNGTSGAQDMTLRDPVENVYRFSTDGAQWMAGLGTYVYEDMNARRIATVAEDYSYPYTQVMGLMAEYCSLGGKVVSKSWVPIGNKDYSSVIAAIPDDVDAVYVALGGADAVNFLSQYQQAGGSAPLVGGSITVDQSVLGVEGSLRDTVIGMPAAGPMADNNPSPDWQDFVAEYKVAFPDGFPSPSLFAHGYYINTMAVLTALDEIDADLSDGGTKLRASLSGLNLDTPTGKVSLDANRNGIADNYITHVVENVDGHLSNEILRIVPQVNQTLGMEADAFLALGVVGRDNPTCE
ncbi:ABC transporter substrate-binding protein [Phaeobacter italicus]|jgi:branched-chain amino acid transport system substrate-binding protein|uniref:ABC transporter substrate-binding protein n=1 Tax=Phaeobacter italicus TaxID=481446 RepID=UPI002FDB2E01